MLQNLKIGNSNRQDPPAVIQDVRLLGQVLPVQPDIQAKGIFPEAVVNGQADAPLFPAAGGDISAAKGFYQNPWGADGRQLFICNQFKAKRSIIKGKISLLSRNISSNACLLYL